MGSGCGSSFAVTTAPLMMPWVQLPAVIICGARVEAGAGAVEGLWKDVVHLLWVSARIFVCSAGLTGLLPKLLAVGFCPTATRYWLSSPCFNASPDQLFGLCACYGLQNIQTFQNGIKWEKCVHFGKGSNIWNTRAECFLLTISLNPKCYQL